MLRETRISASNRFSFDDLFSSLCVFILFSSLFFSFNHKIETKNFQRLRELVWTELASEGSYAQVLNANKQMNKQMNKQTIKNA